MKFKDIPVDQLFQGENVRSEADEELGDLMESIERYDLLTPIIVVPENGRYKIVAGHRRFSAMKARNEATVPCVIHTDLSQSQIPFVQLIENVQRKEMSAHELVQIFDRMKAATPGLSNAAIGRLIGKSGEWVGLQYKAEGVYQSLADQGVSPEVIEDIPDTVLRKMAKVTKPRERKKIAQKVAETPTGKAKVVEQARSYTVQKQVKDPEKEEFWNHVRFSVQAESDHCLIITTKDRFSNQRVQHYLQDIMFEEMFSGEVIVISWSKQWGGHKVHPYMQDTREIPYLAGWTSLLEDLEARGYDPRSARFHIRKKRSTL